MSDHDNASDPKHAPAGDGGPSSGDAEPKEAAARPRRTWRRRVARACVLLVALTLLFRLALAVLLPTVLHKTARQFGFDLAYRRLDLNLLGTQASIWDLVLRPKDRPEVLLSDEYAFANISSLALFRLKLVAYRIEADGVRVNVVRRADGSIPLVDQLKAATASRKGASNDPLRFESPVTVEAVRLHHVELDVDDQSVTPSFRDRLTMDLRLSDLGVPGGPVRLEADLFSRSTLEALRVRGEADLRGDGMTAGVTFAMYGLRLKGAQPYLASLGVQSNDLSVGVAGAAELSLKTIVGKPGAVEGAAIIRDVSLSAGGEEAVRLDHAEAHVSELSPSRLHLGKVAARGGLLRLRRTPEGLLAFASLSPAQSAPARTPSATPALATTPAPGVTAAGPGPAPATQATPFAWRLDEFVASDLVGEFRDQVASPGGRFEARVSSFELKNVTSAGAGADAATLKLVMSIPDVASDVRVTGKAVPFSDAPGATLVFDATGVRPEALRPYLQPLGIEPTLKSGRFHATLDAAAGDLAGGSRKMTFGLADVRLDDGDVRLLDLASVRVSGLTHDAATGALEVATIEATGPALTVRRVEENTLELPAFRYRRVVAAAAPPTSAAPAQPDHRANSATGPASAPVPGPLPILRVNKLTWGGANIRLEDLSTAGAEPVDLSDARLELTGFVLDLRPDAPPSPPGKLTGRFKSPGLVEDVHLDGTLSPGAGSLAADLALGGEGLDLRRLAPYLKPLGVEPRLSRGTLKVSARASVAQSGDTLSVAAEVRDAELTDGGTRLFAMARASVDGFQMSPSGFVVDNIKVSRPYARVERDEDGGFIAGGLKLLPTAARTRPVEAAATRPAPTQPAATPSAATQPAAPPRPALAGEPGHAPDRPADPFEVLAQLPPVTLKSLVLESAEVDWLDRASPKPVELKLTAGATLESFALNQPEPRGAKYDFVFSSPGLADRVHVAGTLEPAPDSISLAAGVDVSGLRPEALAPYLPKGVGPEMKAGTFKTAVVVSLSRLRDGGLSGSLKVKGLELRDDGGAADAPPLAALDGVDVAVDRFDPSSGDLTLSRLAVTGLDASAYRDANGSIALLGLRLAAPASAAPAQPPAGPAADAAPADLQTIVVAAQESMPLVTVKSLDVRVKRLSFEDRLRKAAPVAISDFQLSNDGPVALLGPKPQSNPPVKLNLSGAIEPAVKHFAVAVEAAPFAERPTAKVGIEATGIDGDALIRVAPELAATFDGKPLADGRFRTLLEAEANVRRRGPTRIDLSRGLELNFSVTETALRQGEKGPVLAGVRLVRGEQVKLGVHGGDVTVRSVEVNDLAANAWREQSGIYVLGMRVKGTEAKPEAREEASLPPPGGGTSPVSEQGRVGTAAVTGNGDPEPKAEVRIDRLAVSGLDFRFEDRALDPPVVIPITSLDADFRGLSSLALEKERPVRFNLSVGAGKVTLPKKIRGGVITGAMGDLTKLAGGKQVETAPETEDRDFFAQVAAGGNLKLYPKPAGRALVSVNGVELAAIRGLAASTGVGLNAGTFDGRVDLKVREDDKLDVRSRLVLTDLSVSEPRDGPIVRYLGLPAPLDVVIGAVEAADKSITLPVHFQMDGATPKGIGPAAVGAVSRVLMTAVASMPVKAVTGVAGLFGNTAKEMEVVQEPPVYLEFPSGAATLDAAAESRLAAVLARAKRDKNVRVVIEHELGAADLAVAERRANPPAGQARVLAENLLLRRRELLQSRDDLLGTTRAAALQSGGGAGDDVRLRGYRQLALELAAAEDALDRLYEFQRPGADRLADRRTRAVAIELADGRLSRVRAMVGAIGDAATAERVRVASSGAVSRGAGPSRLSITVARAAPKGKGPLGLR